MQKTSTEYVESMKKPLRNRAYLKASIGIVNSEAQDAADYSNNDFTYYSNIEGIVNNLSVKKVYATAEQDFSAVNGTMYFLPEEDEGKEYYFNGVITNDIRGAVTVNFGDSSSYRIQGLSIDFGICYPTKFNVITNNETKYYENSKEMFITGDTFQNTSFIRIEPLEMLHGDNRLRIVSFLCGVTKMFTNENILSASVTDYSSPITDTVPSMDMSLVIDNQDQFYCPDDDESVYAALEQGQQMIMQYGYDVNGEGKIEWLQPYKCYLSQWSATDKDATFNGVDIFEYRLKDMYINGQYYSNGISLYNLAKDIFDKAGFVEGEYRIDSYLKKIMVKNPIPIVTQAEALQIVANAGRCVLRIERDGVIALDCSFVPKATVSVNNKTSYSNISELLKQTQKEFYAEASQNYASVDKTMISFGDDEQYVENTGYISESIYLEQNGVYAWSGGEAPKITIDFEAAWGFSGLSVNFVGNVPEEMTITTYNDGTIVQTWTYSEIPLNFTIYDYFAECDKLEILINKGAPNSRVFIDSVLISSVTDYRLTRDYDMINSPSAERMDKVQAISVIANDYLASEDTQQAEITLAIPSGTSEHTITFDDPGYSFTATVLEGTGTATIIESGAYHIIIRIISNSDETMKLLIQGRCYDITNKPFTHTYDTTGQIIEWNNPLISDVSYAERLEAWLAQHLLGNVDYTVTWRGDPRVDANDLFYMELKDLSTKEREDTIVRAYQSKLDFNGGWSGELRARKAVIEWR